MGKKLKEWKGQGEEWDEGRMRGRKRRRGMEGEGRGGEGRMPI